MTGIGADIEWFLTIRGWCKFGGRRGIGIIIAAGLEEIFLQVIARGLGIDYPP